MEIDQKTAEVFFVSTALTKDKTLFSGIREEHIQNPRFKTILNIVKNNTAHTPQIICQEAGLSEAETKSLLEKANQTTLKPKDIKEIFVYYSKIRIINEATQKALKEVNTKNKFEILDKAKHLVSLLEVQKPISNNEDCINDYREYIKEIKKNSNKDYIGVSTGINDLDKKIMGIKNHDFILLAARPSMGKTSLATQLFLQGIKAEKGVPVLFSLEMPKEQILGRMLAQVSDKLSLAETIYAKNLQEFGSEIKNKIEFLKENPFYIEDFTDSQGSIGVTPESLRNKLLSMKEDMNQEINMIIIDYAQQLEASNPKLYSNNERLSSISRELKALGREMGCPVILLSQLNRDLEKRLDKRPQMSDLRDSGSLEQDADVILFVYRPDVYLERELKEELKKGNSSAEKELELLEKRERQLAEIIVAKNRNGETGTVNSMFKKQNATFAELTTTLEDLLEDEYGRKI